MRVLIAAFLGLAVVVARAADDAEILERLQERAQRAVLSGAHEEAVTRFKSLARLAPRTEYASAAWWQVARLQEKLGDLQEAFDALQKLVAGSPGHFERAHAEQWRIVRRMIEGLADHDRLAKLRGQKPEKLLAADREALHDMLDTICRNGPQSEVAAQAQFARGMLLERDGRLEEALARHEAFLEMYPEHELADDAACQTAYIRYKQWRGMRSEAPRLRQAAQDALNWFLVRYPQSERASLAFSCLREMIAAERRELESVARFYEGRGNLEAAAVYYRQLAAKDPDLLKQEGPLREKLRKAVLDTPATQETKGGKAGPERPATGAK
jgi:outer membrane protein assembly factor BamD (BamD/ComL family)